MGQTVIEHSYPGSLCDQLVLVERAAWDTPVHYVIPRPRLNKYAVQPAAMLEVAFEQVSV